MTKRIFLCALCQSEFNSFQELIKHVKSVHNTAFTIVGEYKNDFQVSTKR